MRFRPLALVLFFVVSAVANGTEPMPSASAAKAALELNDEQKQEKKGLLERKLEELKRLQAEIKQLRNELDEQQKVHLELQVIEVSETKLRNLGFDWGNIKTAGVGSGQDAAAFCAALCRNNLAKVIAEPKDLTPSATKATFIADDGIKTAVQFDCTPTILDSGKIRLAVRFEISRMVGEDFGLQVRGGGTTVEVEPNTYALIAGDSDKRTTAAGEKQEFGLVFIIKAIPSKK